jgi:anti-sigma regulatory factor (Ser/Thr protein kinase)
VSVCEGIDASRRRELPPEPPSVVEARQLVRAARRAWQVDADAAEDAVIVVGGLVSNVVDHAHAPCVVAISRHDGGVRIEVEDLSAIIVPRVLPLDGTNRQGHGMRVISGLSKSWGVTRHAAGKCVWALVPTR